MREYIKKDGIDHLQKKNSNRKLARLSLSKGFFVKISLLSHKRIEQESSNLAQRKAPQKWHWKVVKRCTVLLHKLSSVAIPGG